MKATRCDSSAGDDGTLWFRRHKPQKSALLPATHRRNQIGVSKSHSPRHRAGVGTLEIAVARQRPQREEFRVTVIAQIENAREPGGGVARLLPKTVGALVAGEIFDAARDRRMIDLARGHQSEQRPGGL